MEINNPTIKPFWGTLASNFCFDPILSKTKQTSVTITVIYIKGHPYTACTHSCGLIKVQNKYSKKVIKLMLGFQGE
jgi:hypothetical protein